MSRRQRLAGEVRDALSSVEDLDTFLKRFVDEQMDNGYAATGHRGQRITIGNKNAIDVKDWEHMAQELIAALAREAYGYYYMSSVHKNGFELWTEEDQKGGS